MDYGIIIPIAAYLVAVQLATRLNAHPLLSTSVAVLLPYVVSLVLKYIFESSADSLMLASLFPLSSIVCIVLQFIMGLYIFKKLRDEESTLSLILWGIGGFIVIVVALPLVSDLIRF